MSTRFHCGCAALFILAMAGCGGAPGGRDLVPAGVPAAIADTRTHAAPVAPGDTFAFAGTLIQSDNATSTRATVSQTVTVTATPYPYTLAPGSADFHSVELDRYASQTVTWSADAWRGLGPARSGIVPDLLYGTRAGDGAGDTYLYRYAAPLVVDFTPERPNQSWTNTGALRYDEHDLDGTSSDILYAADGSYVQRVRFPYSCAYGACELDVRSFPNGSGRYSGTALQASGIASITTSAPSAGSIAINVSFTDGAQQIGYVAAWFAPGTRLYAESDAIVGNVAFPANCAVPKSFGNRGNAIVRNVTRIDPAAGYSETDRTLTYTSAAYGTACVTTDDRRSTHYDFNQWVFSGVPLHRQSIVETLGLRSAQMAGAILPSVRPPVVQLAGGAVKRAEALLESIRKLYKKPIAR